mmetsp:Transcript_16177/g.33229  ORF Transcript_16177/g.33229 Transcript_16177/m.33229 type:complete len:222 (-) Transcript_16177:3159-3824(-)
MKHYRFPQSNDCDASDESSPLSDESSPLSDESSSSLDDEASSSDEESSPSDEESSSSDDDSSLLSKLFVYLVFERTSSSNEASSSGVPFDGFSSLFLPLEEPDRHGKKRFESDKHGSRSRKIYNSGISKRIRISQRYLSHEFDFLDSFTSFSGIAPEPPPAPLTFVGSLVPRSKGSITFGAIVGTRISPGVAESWSPTDRMVSSKSPTPREFLFICPWTRM